MAQLISLTASNTVYGPTVNLTYAYSATQNNGKITSQTDNISGEQVVYTYDALNRLASATATSGSWGQSYSYDGFGNLTGQTVTAGSAPSYQVVPDPSTNHLGGEDANGNAPNTNGTYPMNYAMTYDIENRYIGSGTGSGSFAYGYAPGNKRIYRGVISGENLLTDEVTYWSVSGQKLATYQMVLNGSQWIAEQTGTYYWFGGKLIKNAGGYVAADRLGSIGHYYPYGQEKPSATTNGTEKFTGYLRDAETGLDYADQRYHGPGTGRFMTPDPAGLKAVKPDNPISWNRYAYVKGDPVNRNDPLGFADDGKDPSYCDVYPDDPECSTIYPIAPPPPSGPSGPLYTWSLDVGYTPVVNLGGNRNSYDHLFIWLHPTGDTNPADGIVFDGGPAQPCNTSLQCGGTIAFDSEFGLYLELQNSAAVDFFTTQLGGSNNVYASYVAGQLIEDTALIYNSAANHPYNPVTGPTSNSVVYSELQSVGINVPIFSANLPFLGTVGVLSYQVNGQTQLFTGWGQNLLP